MFILCTTHACVRLYVTPGVGTNRRKMAKVYFHSDKSSCVLAFDEFAVAVSGPNDIVSVPSVEEYNNDEEYTED